MRRKVDEHPVRPAIPPVLVCALGLWAGCAVVYSSARTWSVDACVIIGVVTGLVASTAAVLLWRMRGTVGFCLVVGLLVGVMCGCAGSAALHALEQEVQSAPAGRMRFEMVEDGSKGSFGSQCVARVRLESGLSVLVRLNFEKDERLPRYGDVVEADASLALPKERAAEFSWQRGVVATATARQSTFIERSDVFGSVLRIRSAVIDAIGALGGESAAALQALVCGWRAELDDTDTYEAFKVTGLAHVIAVSGSHLVIVCGLVGAMFKAMRVPRSLALGVQVALMLGYLVLAAAPISAVRAAVMSIAGMTSFFAQRRAAGINALGVCILSMIALDPSAALSVAFALSALSTLGILLFARLFCSWIDICVPRIPRFANEALSLTIASSVVVQLLSASLFSQLSLVAPIANVLVAPLLPLVCAGGLVAALLFLVVPFVGAPLLAAAAFCSGVLCVVVRFCANIPFASIPLDVSFPVAFCGTIVAVVTLWAFWPRLKLKFAALGATFVTGCLAIYVAVGPYLVGNEIVMLDVGQGDAFLIRSEGSTVLVDTGNQDGMLRAALARHGICRLDAVVVTHADDDHCGSLASLKGIVQVDRVLLARDALACPCVSCVELRADAHHLAGESHVEGLSTGDEIRVGVVGLTVVWPEHFEDEGGNADSLCMLARADVNSDGVTDWTALFMGDAEHEELSALMDSGVVGCVDILKVGHHGSKNALTPVLAETLRPRLALVSSGEGNRYGHPADKTLEELENVDTQIWRTDRSGDVSCKLRLEGIVVETLR